MALLLSLRGSVSLYQGEELGLTEAMLDEDDLRDPFGIAYWPEFRGRDGSRTPMPWSAGTAHGGFTTAQAPWLPVPEAHRSMATDSQEADESSMLHAFRRFLHWRRGEPALVHGTLQPLALPSPLVGFIRDYEGQSVLAVFNLSDQAVPIDLTAFDRSPPMQGNGFEGCLDGNGRLQPFGVLFAELAAVSAPPPMADARR
jgi:alpha-glucosidase